MSSVSSTAPPRVGNARPWIVLSCHDIRSKSFSVQCACSMPASSDGKPEERSTHGLGPVGTERCDTGIVPETLDAFSAKRRVRLPPHLTDGGLVERPIKMCVCIRSRASCPVFWPGTWYTHAVASMGCAPGVATPSYSPYQQAARNRARFGGDVCCM